MLEFPNINPVAIDLGIFQIRWYAISYIAGILFSWGLILNIIKFKNLKVDNKVISELISNSMIGIIIGGRLGYVIFYNPDYYLNNLLEISKDKTTIIVSHRVSSAKNADKIIIIDEGQIIQEGTHNQLVNQDGYYAELYAKQLSEKELN